MPFPDKQRFIYRKNPLERVICQLRFPTILKIQASLPVEFQEKIRTGYPILQERNEVDLQLPSEVEQLFAEAIVDPRLRKPAYDFISKDGEWTVSLAGGFLALTALKYKRWEDFKDHLEGPFNALKECYAPSFFSRIGLRYVNVINKSKLGIDDSTHWSELITSPISGALTSDKVAGYVVEHSGSLRVNLKDVEGQVRVQYGLGQDQLGNKGFLIDSDFFIEGKMEIDDAYRKLDDFRTRNRRLFRWCITDKLHNIMEPGDRIE